MSDIPTILDFEGNTEAIFVQILRDLGLPAYSSDTNEDLPIPRVDVVATLAESGPHQRRMPNGEWVYDQHSMTVSVSYHFAPDTPDLVKTVSFFRGTMRRLLFFPRPILDAFEDQGYYRAAAETIRETAGIRQIDTDENTVTLETVVPMVLFLTETSLGILGPDTA